jgi:hypothetical protein
MSHFYIDSLPVGYKEVNLPGPVFGWRVHYAPDDGGVLIIIPTEVPVIRPGLPFVEIGMKFPSLVPYPREPGRYKDVRESGINRKQYPNFRWWVSTHTQDPGHILIAWDGETVIGPKTDGGIVTLN